MSLKGNLPGHCVIVVDMAENKETAKVFHDSPKLYAGPGYTYTEES